MSRHMVFAVIVLACCATAMATVACFLMLRSLRRARAQEASLRASLVRHKEALQQAERKTLHKTNAFAGASHDIRSALAAITGLIDVSRVEARMHPQMLQNLEQMDVCAKKLLGILNSILDTNKVESGRMQLEEGEFDLANVLEESMDMINVLSISKGLEVVWDPCDLSILKCGNVKGDCRRFKQILDNLLGNSVKFTEEGHVVLRAWANKPIARSSICLPSRFVLPSPLCNFLCLFKTREQRAHQHAFSSIQNDPNTVEFYFEVDDTGIGIPKEKRELVFENYVQVKEGQGGTGLGLGIVQCFVRLMGGEISIMDKEPGETGTCIGFNVFMKMGLAQEEHDIEEGRSIPSIETSEPNIQASAFREANSFEGGHCVLLVHGDETRKILRSWMENLGLRVWLVPQLELLASTLEKVCRANSSLARTSSASFECRTDYCFKPSDTINQILPIALKNSNSFKNGVSGGNWFGVLIVIDAHYGKMEDICAEINFADIKNQIPCKVVCVADIKTSSTDLKRFRHTCCDLVLQKPIHGSRLHVLLRTLRDLQQISNSGHPSHVNPDNAETSTAGGSSGAGTSAMIVHSAQEPEGDDDRPLARTRVLLVEDTLTLQTIGKRILYQLGATVELAGDGSKALSMFKTSLEQAADSETDAVSSPYDVILMDCQMPVMDGYEATRRIRETESRFGIHTPIIALTAQAIEDEVQKTTILAGMDLHLTKPMERTSIVEAIRRVCRDHHRLDASVSICAVSTQGSSPSSCSPDAEPGFGCAVHATVARAAPLYNPPPLSRGTHPPIYLSRLASRHSCTAPRPPPAGHRRPPSSPRRRAPSSPSLLRFPSARWIRGQSSTGARITGGGAGSWRPAAARSSVAGIATTTPRTRWRSTRATGTRSLAMKSKRLSALSAQNNRMCSRIALIVGPAWENTFVKNANSSMMMSQRTNTTAMDVAYAVKEVEN